MEPNTDNPEDQYYEDMDFALRFVCSMIDEHPDLAEQPVQTLIMAMGDIIRNAKE